METPKSDDVTTRNTCPFVRLWRKNKKLKKVTAQNGRCRVFQPENYHGLPRRRWRRWRRCEVRVLCVCLCVLLFLLLFLLVREYGSERGSQNPHFLFQRVECKGDVPVVVVLVVVVVVVACRVSSNVCRVSSNVCCVSSK